jgi:branched-chain amino acid aminotransferase
LAIESKFIWLDGELVEYEKATVHFLSGALHYGAAVFEGIRAYGTERGPAVFRLPEHARRLIESAEIFGFRDLPYTAENVSQAIIETVRANGYTECYIRPLIFVRDGITSLNLDTVHVSLGIAVWEWRDYLGEEALSKGIRANISSYTRHHPNVMMTKAKIAGNYANSILAKTESVRLGFDEAIMLDPQGFVAECTGENLFVVRKGRIITPDLSPVLEGVTRDAVWHIASDLGYGVIEQPVSRDQLYTADEVFVCGTVAEVIGLREIDFRAVGDGTTGPVTRSIQVAFAEAVRGRSTKYEDWLTYVS